MKYVSDYDLVSYGATKTVVNDVSTFKWDSNPENILDKYGQQSAPLKDLDGRTIDKPGWYDFTRRSSDKTVTDPDTGDVFPEWLDGGQYIYGDYYSSDYGVDVDGNPLVSAGSWVTTTDIDADLPEGVVRRIIGLELNFTDNKFGDKDVQLDRILTRLVPVQQMVVLPSLPQLHF